MNCYGIIAAVEAEMAAIKNIMTECETVNHFEKEFIIGKIEGKKCVLSLCGVGKVNAARTTQFLIDCFSPDAMINVGSAGALSEDLAVGDIVLSSSAVQADFDITAFGREKGFITGVGKNIVADKNLVEQFKKVISSFGNTKVTVGTVATSDCFVNNFEAKKKIGDEFSALCCEMEGAAVAQVCYLCNIPFIIIRSISDDLYSKAEVDFEKYLITASEKCAEFLSAALKIK